jgi:hypothetical protein
MDLNKDLWKLACSFLRPSEQARCYPLFFKGWAPRYSIGKELDALIEARDDAMIEHVLRVYKDEVKDISAIVCILAAGHGHMPLLQRFFLSEPPIPHCTLFAAGCQGRLDVLEELMTQSFYRNPILDTVRELTRARRLNPSDEEATQIAWGLATLAMGNAGHWNALHQVRAQRGLDSLSPVHVHCFTSRPSVSLDQCIANTKDIRSYPSYCPEWLSIPRTEEERVVELEKYWVNVPDDVAEEVFMAAVTNQFFEVAKWVDSHSTFAYTNEICFALGKSCNHSFFAWWLTRHPPPTDPRVCGKLSFAIGASLTVQGMEELFRKDTTYMTWLNPSLLASGVLRSRRFDVAMALFERFPSLGNDIQLTNDVMRMGKVRSLEWLRTLNPPCPLNPNALEYAKTQGQWSVVHWLLDHEALGNPDQRRRHEEWCRDRFFWQWRKAQWETWNKTLSFLIRILVAIVIVYRIWSWAKQ